MARISEDSVTSIVPESIDAVRSMGTELLREHWLETRPIRGEPFEPDWCRYYELEERGVLRTLCAYRRRARVEPELVGYSINYLLSHQHSSRYVFLQNDAVFVGKKHRPTGIGPQLVLATETLARELGARMMMWGAPIGGPLAEMLPKLGYVERQVTLTKEL